MGEASPLEGRMVFLVGARRSGTNWLQRTLCAHPAALAVPSETHLFSHGLAPLADRFQHGAIGSPKTAKVYLPRAEARAALRDVADRVFGGLATALGPDAQLVVERTPWHVYHLDLIGEVYPDAAVVHILRDGRDVARSLLSQPWGPTTMAEAATEWRTSVEAARSFAPGLRRFREVRYEELLADPATELAALHEWLGLPTGPDVVAAALVEAGVTFNTDARAPQVGAGKWRSGMSAADQRTFDRIAGDLLEDVGYDREAPPGALAALAPRDLASRARRAARAARRRADPVRRPGLPATDRPRPPEPRSVLRMEQLQAVLDRVLAAFVEGDAAALDELLVPDALVERVRGADAVGGRDAAARTGFLDAVAAAGAARGPQLRADVHPAEAVAVAVLTSAGDAGPVTETVVARITGDHVDRLAWYAPGDG